MIQDVLNIISSTAIEAANRNTKPSVFVSDEKLTLEEKYDCCYQALLRISAYAEGANAMHYNMNMEGQDDTNTAHKAALDRPR